MWAEGAALSLGEAIAELHALAVDHTAATSADVADLSASDRQSLSLLSPREREVLSLVAEGLGDKDIASELGISRRTASKHVATILTKLGVRSRTAAASHAMRQGLVGASESHLP
jgi:DNA-binding NarL/FixJ family response regulator